MNTEQQTIEAPASAPCPRRQQEIGPWDRNAADSWRANGTCSFCGSMHPDEFMRRAEAGEEIDPTDKDYKAYVGARAKFYFQHLSGAQQQRFIELLNAGTIKLGYPGHFYVRPFFVRTVA
jgi:hypothetical protein